MNSQPKKRYLNLYFQVHQPKRLGQFSFFDIGTTRDYFDDGLNQLVMRRVSQDCYQPTNLLLLKLFNRFPNLRVTFSISGSALKQMETFSPATLESFRMLAATGKVEFLAETYYHSLACLISREEFNEQVGMHVNKIHQLMGVVPSVFRNTELIYSDAIGKLADDLGFKGIFADGIEKILGERSPNFLYAHPDRNLKVFLRNYRLSDDISFRFMQKKWGAWPLTPRKYLAWLEKMPDREEFINLSLDYETFGEHLKYETGIFKFLEGLLSAAAKHKNITMVTPSEAIQLLEPADTVKVPENISWADKERNLSAWLGNDMQRDAFITLKKLEIPVKNINNADLLNTWRYLQTSDHYYYMSTKNGDDGNIHNYFSPYPSPYEAFMNYMNVLTDFSLRIERQLPQRRQEEKEHPEMTA